MKGIGGILAGSPKGWDWVFVAMVALELPDSLDGQVNIVHHNLKDRPFTYAGFFGINYPSRLIVAST